MYGNVSSSRRRIRAAARSTLAGVLAAGVPAAALAAASSAAAALAASLGDNTLCDATAMSLDLAPVPGAAGRTWLTGGALSRSVANLALPAFGRSIDATTSDSEAVKETANRDSRPTASTAKASLRISAWESAPPPGP